MVLLLLLLPILRIITVWLLLWLCCRDGVEILTTLGSYGEDFPFFASSQNGRQKRKKREREREREIEREIERERESERERERKREREREREKYT